MGDERARTMAPANPQDAGDARPPLPVSENLEALLQESLVTLRDLVGHERSAIHLLVNGLLVLRATDPPLLSGPEAAKVAVGQGLAGRVVASGQSCYIADLTEDARAPRAPSEGISAGARSYFAVPLVHAGEVVGVLQVDAPEGDAFPEEARRRVVTFAATIAQAVHSASGRGAAAAREPDGDVLSLVAHELKAPLTSVRGLAATLAELAGRLDRETIEEIARRITRASERLDRIVADLLDVSSSGRRQLQVDLSVVGLEPIVREAAQQSPGSHPVIVKIEPGLPRVIADPQRLHQVLENLLSNAEKFSPPGSPIRIRVRRTDARVAIGVEDRGEGIPREHLDRIFDRFYQVQPPPGGARRGLGIGLSLVREICDAMGADVEVRSEVGRGSIFTVLLPMATQS